MSTQKVSDSQWAAARKRYETEPGLGYGAIAQALDCSKNLVARKAKEQAWQKDVGVPAQVGTRVSSSDPKVTENAVHAAARAPNVYAAGASESPPQPSRAPSPESVTTAPPTLPDKPDFASWDEEAEWVERQVADQQNALMKRHAIELQHLSRAIYDGLKKVNQKGVGEASRAANALSQAMQRKHKLELDHLAESTRIRLGVYRGDAGPRPVRIIVRQMEGVSIGSTDNTPAAIARRNLLRRVIDAARAELLEAGFDPQAVADALAKVCARLSSGDLQDVESRDVVAS